MAVLSIRAKIECEGCGAAFSVEMDPAHGPTLDWSLFDYAKDAVRGSVRVEVQKGAAAGMSSVQADKMLCPSCTRACDSFTDEDRDLTEAEVKRALAKAGASNG